MILYIMGYKVYPPLLFNHQEEEEERWALKGRRGKDLHRLI